MTEPKKILLVDDSDVVAGMLTRLLQNHGYTVVRAADGARGIEMAYAEIPDLIVMDVEMPLIQGYQASRLLKHRRGVRDIPIIMHTSLSEDRDKYWAFNSGADAFVNKDFDNLDGLLGQISAILSDPERPRIDRDRVAEEARAVDRDAVFEMMGTLFDGQLFQSSIVNMLGETGKRIGSVRDTVETILDILSKVCDYHLAVVLLAYNRRPMAFIRPGKEVFGEDVSDFLSVCFSDFYRHFPRLDMEATERIYLGIDDRTDFDKIRLDGHRVSSYAVFEIRGKGGAVVGSLHAGNLTNNYFSDHILGHIGMFVDYAGPFLENTLLFNHVTEMEDRIRNVFAKFVPREIIDDLVERGTEDAYLTGEKREVAVLFSDIRSFTTISENNSAENVVGFLNGFFNIMVGIIKEHGGTIDKFIGDAILAIFGAPKSYPDNALRAVRAAREMIAALPSVDLGALALPDEGFGIGVGIHEGVAVVGNIGSAEKFDYTVIGDTVNLASRLEGLTKHYHKPILVSEAVAGKIDDAAFLRLADTVRVKGRDRPTEIYAVEMDSVPFDKRFMDAYGKGLKLYRLGNWSTALEYFTACLEQMPGDPVAAMYAERCRRFMEAPPVNWDGAVALDFK